MDFNFKDVDQTPVSPARKYASTRRLLLVSSACSLVAAGTIVCALFPRSSARTHTNTSTSTDNTTRLRSSKRPTVTSNVAAVVAAAGRDRDGSDLQAFPAGNKNIKFPPRLQDHRESLTSAPHAIVIDGKEGGTNVEDVNVRTRNVSDGMQTGGGQGGRGGRSLPQSSRPLVDDQFYNNPAEAAAAAAAMMTTRRATGMDEGGDPQGQPEPKGFGSTTPVTQDFKATSVDEGEGICSPREVVGLDDCPELVPEEYLDTKAEMLRQIIKILTDPTSAGQGGNPDEPLLLVMKLMLDESDAIFYHAENFAGHAVDPLLWSPLPGGFNRWVEMYHQEVLRQTRPVVVTIHGNNVCELEEELSLAARLKAAGVQCIEQLPSTGGDNSDEGSPILENFEVPVVLMTLGWDGNGDPTHIDRDRDVSCAYRMLEMGRVAKWFTAHARHESLIHPKFRYLPLGFGGFEIVTGLPHTAFIDAAKHQLNILETCPVGEIGSYDLIFQCNAIDMLDVRRNIWAEMTEGKGPGSPVPVNRYKLEAADMVTAAAKGIFAVSPPGTGPDCFRHYEMMVAGNIALVPDTPRLRRIMEGLPAFFLGELENPWDSLTCGKLLEMREVVQAKIKEGQDNNSGGLQFEKLTHGFWRGYIRREVLRAGGVSDESTATYVERSIVPLKPQGWTTFRRVGCFTREEVQDPQDQDPQDQNQPHLELPQDTSGSVVLTSSDRTPEGCATHCSGKAGGGIGFFGISSGDTCWCDEIPRNVLPINECHIDCDGEDGAGRCGGDSTSAVYIFGPEAQGAPFEYMGCFLSAEHDMFHSAVRLGNASTPEICEAFCTSNRYPFFALEKADLCRCGATSTNSPSSDKLPAYIEGGGYEPSIGSSNATRIAKPSPEGVQVGDPRFLCHQGRCGGNPEMMGCGTEIAYDLYRNTEPCVLYQAC